MVNDRVKSTDTQAREDTDPPHAPATIEVPEHRHGPPKIYIAACGALCDIFWWARR